MAYASAISLKHTIERLIINPQITKSAYEELELVKETLTRLDGSICNRNSINLLDDQIREAASKLEDALESYSFHRSLPPSRARESSPPPQIPRLDENGVKQEIDFLLNAAKILKEKYKKELENTSLREEDDAAASQVDDSGVKKSTETVVLKDQFKKIINEPYPLEIKKGEEDYGNFYLQVLVTSSWKF